LSGGQKAFLERRNVGFLSKAHKGRRNDSRGRKDKEKGESIEKSSGGKLK